LILKKGVQITKVSAEDVKAIYLSRHFLRLEPSAYLRYQDLHVIKCKARQIKGEPLTIKNRDLFHQIALSLLVFQEGQITVGPMFRRDELAFIPLAGVMFTYGPDAGMPIFGGEYVITKEQTRSFVSLYKTLSKKIESSGFLRRSLERFRLSYHDYHNEERIIDYIICLESLYLPRELQELSFKLALRVANLLNAEFGIDKHKAYDDIYAAVRLRGAVVHGEEPKVQKIIQEYGDMPSFVRVIEDYTRKSLRLFLKDPARRSEEFFRDLVL
jgi:hypothetical protein